MSEVGLCGMVHQLQSMWEMLIRASRDSETTPLVVSQRVYAARAATNSTTLFARGNITTTMIPFPIAGARAQDISAAELKKLLTANLYGAQ